MLCIAEKYWVKFSSHTHQFYTHILLLTEVESHPIYSGQSGSWVVVVWPALLLYGQHFHVKGNVLFDLFSVLCNIANIFNNYSIVNKHFWRGNESLVHLTKGSLEILRIGSLSYHGFCTVIHLLRALPCTSYFMLLTTCRIVNVNIYCSQRSSIHYI